jgi:FtsH-binding integral membrane protein
MNSSARIAALRYALMVTGVIFIGGIATLARVWPAGWSWGVGHSHYWPMVLGVYATLGVFLIRAARDPLGNRSLIWFAVWSSVVHALVMASSAVGDPAEHGHLIGDVPALLLVAGALAFLTRRAGVETGTTKLGFRRVA